jgi:hypothetical protein
MKMILPFALGIAVMAFVYSPCIQAEHNSITLGLHGEEQRPRIHQRMQNHIAGILETFEVGLRTNEFDEEKFRLGFADILRDIRLQIKEDATRDTAE